MRTNKIIRGSFKIEKKTMTMMMMMIGDIIICFMQDLM